MTSRPWSSSRCVIRSTAGCRFPKVETPISRALDGCGGRRDHALAMPAAASTALAIAARVMRLSEMSPMVGNIAMSLAATYHCTAAVAATGVIMTLGNATGSAAHDGAGHRGAVRPANAEHAGKAVIEHGPHFTVVLPPRIMVCAASARD